MKHFLVTLARRHNDLEGHTTQQLFKYYLYFILCLEHHYCEVAFTYFKVKFAKCICLLPMVLASWQRLKWSCETDLTKPQRVTGGVDGGEACGWS